MTDEIFFNGIRYLSSTQAAQNSGLNPDYVAQLCRGNKIHGRRIGRNWYVGDESLSSFLVSQSYQKSLRREELARERVNEYHSSTPLTVNGPTSLTAPGSTPLGKNKDQGRPPNAEASSRPSEKSIYGPGAREKSEKGKRIEASATSPILHNFNVHAALAKAAARKASALPGGAVRAAVSAGSHLSAQTGISSHTLAPVTNFFHKVLALTVALMLTLGTYAFVNPDAAAFALNSLQRAERIAMNAYSSLQNGDLERLALEARSQLAAAASDPGSILDTLVSAGKFLARSFTTTIDSYLYALSFPEPLTRSSPSVVAAITSRPAPASINGSTPFDNTQGEPLTTSQPARTERVERVIERVVETERIVTAGGISEEILEARVKKLNDELTGKIYSLASANTTHITQVYNTLGAVARGDNYDDINIDDSDITNSRISGSSVDATTLTVSGATTLTSLTTSGDATISGALTVSGNLTVSGAQTLSGAITIPYLNATSTTASTFLNASTTLLSVTSRAYFGGTSTTTIDSIGSITLPSAALLTAPYASSTALSALGALYVGGTGTTTIRGDGLASTIPYASTTALTVSGTASTTDLIISSLTATRIPFIATDGAFTDSANLTFASDILSSPSFLATASTTLQNFTFVNATGTQATTTNFAISSITSGSLLKTTTGGAVIAAVAGTDYVAGSSFFAYLFPSDATSTKLSFTGGILSTASTTIGNGTQTGGLTVSGGAA